MSDQVVPCPNPNCVDGWVTNPVMGYPKLLCACGGRGTINPHAKESQTTVVVVKSLALELRLEQLLLDARYSHKDAYKMSKRLIAKSPYCKGDGPQDVEGVNASALGGRQMGSEPAATNSRQEQRYDLASAPSTMIEVSSLTQVGWYFRGVDPRDTTRSYPGLVPLEANWRPNTLDCLPVYVVSDGMTPDTTEQP